MKKFLADVSSQRVAMDDASAGGSCTIDLARLREREAREPVNPNKISHDARFQQRLDEAQRHVQESALLNGKWGITESVEVDHGTIIRIPMYTTSFHAKKYGDVMAILKAVFPKGPETVRFNDLSPANQAFVKAKSAVAETQLPEPDKVEIPLDHHPNIVVFRKEKGYGVLVIQSTHWNKASGIEDRISVEHAQQRLDRAGIQNAGPGINFRPWLATKTMEGNERRTHYNQVAGKYDGIDGGQWEDDFLFRSPEPSEVKFALSSLTPPSYGVYVPPGKTPPDINPTDFEHNPDKIPPNSVLHITYKEVSTNTEPDDDNPDAGGNGAEGGAAMDIDGPDAHAATNDGKPPEAKKARQLDDTPEGAG